ncbi:HWE histidine kinase domain-containing protein [Pseudooceanicola nanhaiensis]|uniref:HWE histidine kinase domain-containing protein n=1 Tax=Pseudooceanicola nanhaiensis TaxID=375761 RepID=UPI001CD6EA6E|nr:HWE histidine kinase domain-containing protein [Pseudooceanicola nanhaiensis]MCA0922322.1 GAF domain-containing protein [Pseudooceanicola nanhaiensis]
MTDPFISTDTPVDLTNCDREPIHILGNVQSFGALVAISADWIIQHVSANAEAVLGLKPDAIIGLPLSDFLPRTTVARLREKLSAASHENSIGRIFGFDVFENGNYYDVSAHQSGLSFIFEFEAKSRGNDHDELAMVTPMLKRISSKPDLISGAEAAAEQLRELTGFDRVMVYQFGPEGDGTVIAEAKDMQDTESYLGLHFPASDIPRQARELYKRSLLRLISDVDDEVAPIVPAVSPEGRPLDLSLAVTRAVSPVHLEYLRNMNVRASMSVSIVIRGELWGLMACHHRAPLYIDYERRTAIELLAQFFAYEVERQEGRAASETSGHAQKLHDRLMMRMSSGENLGAAFPAIAREIGKVIPHTGIALYTDGTYIGEGDIPEKEDFEVIARFLNTSAASRVYATDNLVARLPSMAHVVDRCAGILAIPVSRRPRDYIVLFRTEVAQQVKWAGNPHKPVEVGALGTRLTPRKSFELWQEDVRNRSEQWSPASLRAAEAIRITLLEVVLKLADEVNAERKRAQDQQELLIAELNHRVRNVLGLIRSLVAQSRKTATSLQEFTAAVDGRVHALAQAHDQLTNTEFRPVAFRNLLRVELEAYITGEEERVEVTGPTILLAPEAYATMALVFHELVTNSVKYGALSVPTGRVAVDIEQGGDGLWKLRWSESGGPAVQTPERRGFGTTIIEKSIPFELNGEARTDFAVTGLRAEFLIPERYITAEARKIEIGGSEERADGPEETPERLSGVALVVEDNMIIAMDAADILSDLGADRVLTASTVNEALRVIEANTLTLGVLDVHLGSETSLNVARKLAERGIPFILASGYGSNSDSLGQYPTAPVINKPFTVETLSRAVVRLQAGAKG